MHTDPALREHLARLLTGRDAHATFDDAVSEVPPDLYGRPAQGAPHTLWQILEHMRIAQWDILQFCIDPAHASPPWPEGYWPETPAPPSPEAWAESIVSFRSDRHALIELARNPEIDLLATIPHGQGQTFLREVLLAADHTAYHVGQMVLLRRLLGAWPGA